MKDFFISYNKADKTWAEWIAWELEANGYSTVIQAWDFRPGSNFVLEMQQAAAGAERTIAVLSPDYLASEFTQPEWAAAFAKDPTGKNRSLLPVRVRKCDLEGLLPQIVYIDLVGKSEADAQSALLAGLQTGRVKPTTKPNPFGMATQAAAISGKPRFPGALPDVWNVPHERNPNFTGRGELLEQLHQTLMHGQQAALTQALHGLGGVGKTQTAVEYAYRHGGEYDCVWWVRSEEPATRDGDYAALAEKLGLPEAAAQDQRQVVAAVKHWLERHPRWLLILDNVPHPKDIDGLIPQGSTGHVIVTSRDPNWLGRATRLKVELFERPVSVDFLLKRPNSRSGRSPTEPVITTAGLQEGGRPAVGGSAGSGDPRRAEAEAANQLAQELGDLPLALAQAVAYMDEAQVSVGRYLELFRQRRTDLWGEEHGTLGHQETVAVTFGLSIDRLSEPAAVELLNVCAFLAPDDVPRWLFQKGGKHLPERLAAAASNEVEFNRLLKLLRSHSLIELTDDSLSVHRLIQAVCRDRLDRQVKAPQTSEVSKTSEVSATESFAAAAVRLVDAAYPGGDLDDLAEWPICQRLLPHSQSAATQAEQFDIELIATDRLLNQMGLYLQIRAEFIEAKSVLERAVRIAEKAFGPDHPEVATDVSNLGLVLQDSGDLTGAMLAYERAFRIDEAAFGLEHPTVARDVNNLGTVLQQLGDLPGAKNAYERALEIAEMALGPDHPKVADAASNLGDVLGNIGDLSGAKQALERAMKIDEAAFGPEHPSVAIRMNNLGSLLWRLDDLTGAKQAIERALGIFSKFLGDRHPTTKTIAKNLETINRQLGQSSK